jgi:hypothetical protein
VKGAELGHRARTALDGVVVDEHEAPHLKQRVGVEEGVQVALVHVPVQAQHGEPGLLGEEAEAGVEEARDEGDGAVLGNLRGGSRWEGQGGGTEGRRGGGAYTEAPQSATTIRWLDDSTSSSNVAAMDLLGAGVVLHEAVSPLLIRGCDASPSLIRGSVQIWTIPL